MLRPLAWSSGRLLVRVLSPLARFELPDDALFPWYQLRLLLGTHERETLAVCRRLLRPGMVAIDVGAHAGYFSVRFARWVGATGRVLAFEPHPASFEVLRRNVGRRGLRNVRLARVAISDREGEAAFWETPSSFGHSLHRVKGQERSLRVEATTLDDACRKEGLGVVDLVKLDVEGAELEALAGMTEIARSSPAMAVILEFKPELCERRGARPADWLDAVARLGLTDVTALPEAGRARLIEPGDGPALAAVGKCNLLARKPRRAA